MVILYGTIMCGQADVVEKRFSVATQFVHVFYCPLLPIGSRVVIDDRAPKHIRQSLEPPKAPEDASEADEQPADEQVADEQAADEKPADEQGADELRIGISMCWKSVLLGYLRGWGFWLTVFCGFLGGMLWLMSVTDSDAEAAGMFPGFLWTAGVALVVAMASYYGPWNRASPARARQLCEEIGLDPATLPNELRERTPGAGDA